MKRFDPSTYVLPELPKGAGTKALAQHAIKRKALTKPDPSWTGKWDAEIEFEYRTDSGRKKVSHPFLQDCHPDVSDDDWLGNLRRRYAEIVNAELKQLKSAIRFDPRSLEERGISKISDEHLGLKKSYRERQGKPTKRGAQNEQNQWDYEHAELLRQHPGGDRPDGKPEHVAGYVTGFVELIHARLQSRPKYVSYYAHRQADADEQTNPTPSTKRRNKRRDYRVEWLAEQAGRALDNINEAWMGISAWAKDLTIESDQERKVKRSSTRLPAAQSMSERSTLRSSSIRDNSVASAQPEGVQPAEPRSTSRAGVNSATNSSSKSSADAPKALAFEDQLVVLREHQIEFQIGRETLLNSSWALTATLSDADAKKHALPVKIVARRSEERQLLLELHRELCRQREEAVRTSEMALAAQHDSTERKNDRSAPDPGKRSDAPPFTFEAVFPHDLPDRSPRMSPETPPRSNVASDDRAGAEQGTTPTSTVENTQGKTHHTRRPNAPTASVGATNEPASPKGSAEIVESWAADLVANGKLRKTLICRVSDEKMLVREPLSDTRIVALAGLPAKLAADLLALADTQEIELHRMANFIARNSAQMRMEGWRDALTKSEAGVKMADLFGRWSENADFRRAADRMKKQPVSDGTDAHAPGHALSAEISALTGLTDADLTGRSIDGDDVAEMLEYCDGVIAYNAAFDRPFVEKLIGRHVAVPWGCAMADVPWRQLGFEPGPQGYAVMQAGYYMPAAHRAKDDVLALVELLDHACADGETVMAKMLAAIEAPAWRFEAQGAPYGYKDDLREQRYRWAWGRLHDLWHKHVRAEAYQDEFDWYVSTIGKEPVIVPLPASERYRCHRSWTPA